jgi:hypothetical protein
MALFELNKFKFLQNSGYASELTFSIILSPIKIMAEEQVPIVLPAEHYPIQIMQWSICQGASVTKDQKLGLYEYLDESGATIRAEIRSANEGIMGEMVKAGSVCATSRYFSPLSFNAAIPWAVLQNIAVIQFSFMDYARFVARI